jgi:hypothetical protein
MKLKIQQFFAIHGVSLATGLMVLLLVFQYSQISEVLGRTAAHRTQVMAFDDDAGMIVDRAVKTRWYKDNGVAGYGPLYFRIAHSVARLLGPATIEAEISETHAVERSHHMVLMTMSLLALFGIAAILAWVLRERLLERLVLISVLLGAFMFSPVWSLFLFRVHPDFLFSFFVLLATWLTFLCLEDEKYFVLSAVVWGLAASTKLTIVLFGPAFLLLWLPPWTKANGKKTLRYLSWILATYFVVGFPQSVNIGRPISFLLGQGAYSVPMDFDSLLEWLTLTGSQIAIPLLVLLIAAVSFPGGGQRRLQLSQPTHRRFLLFVLLSYLLLITRKVTTAHDYYTFPFICTLLLLAVLGVRGWRGQWRWAPLALLVAAVFWPRLIPATFFETYSKQRRCRPEALQLEHLLADRLRQGEKIYVDPYVPLNSEEYKGQVGFTWEITWSQIKDLDPRLIVIHLPSAETYFRMDSEPDVQRVISTYNPDWRESQSFYRLFGQQNRVTDPDGGQWRKTWAACEWLVWEKL